MPIGPDAMLIDSSRTVPAGVAALVFTNPDAMPPIGYEYRASASSLAQGSTGPLLRFVNNRKASTPPVKPLKSELTVYLPPAPTKPYIRWLRKLGCNGCSIEIRTPKSWAKWNGKAVRAGETYRVRRASTVAYYAVIPSDDPRC